MNLELLEFFSTFREETPTPTETGKVDLKSTDTPDSAIKEKRGKPRFVPRSIQIFEFLVLNLLPEVGIPVLPHKWEKLKKGNIFIEEAFVCGSFFLVLKLTNNSKVLFMKFVVLC
jgi:hypothetical protein